jgi:hypothetical protein
MYFGKKKNFARHPGIIFWAIFVIVLILLLVLNREAILSNLHGLGINLPPFFKQQVVSPPVETENPPASETGQPAPVSENLVLEAPIPVTEPIPIEQFAPDAVRSIAVPNTGASGVPQNEKARTVYFLSIDQNGNLRRAAVTRLIPDTESPLTKTLEALLAGLSKNEQEQKFISLIPEGTKLLLASIQQGTAYINFNEEFLYNTYGKEGYAGQIKQVLWTATEFPTVKKVQILIEGQKESYLGENIWIGGPLERENFPNF